MGHCIKKRLAASRRRAAWRVAPDPGPTTLELIPATGLVDRVELVDFNKQSAAEGRAINERIAARHYDAVVLSLPTPAHFFQRAIISIPIRVGHCLPLSAPPGVKGWGRRLWPLRRALITGEFSRRLLLNRKIWVSAADHAVQRNLRLLGAFGLPIPDPAPKPRIPLPAKARGFADRALGRRRARVGVHLGVADNPYFKIWPAERFGRLCRSLEEAGLECILLGGPDEKESVRRAQEASGRELRTWVGRCTLLETFALVAACDLFVSNDTGLAKAAMALGVSTATLWGPTEPQELGTLWDKDKHLDFSRKIECSPCVLWGMTYRRAAIDYLTCGHHECLTALDEGEVLAALKAKYPQLFPAV